MQLCLSIKNKNVYYRFNENRWQQDPELCSLNIKLSTEVASYYENVASCCLQQASCLTFHDEKQHLHSDTSKKLKAIALKLKSTVFKDNIIAECSNLFNKNCKDFYEALNSQQHLLAFNNGV